MGRSAQAILQQLTLRGPGRSWVSFPLFFRWTPRYEELPLALRSDQGSGRCRVESFEARADFQAVYPVWAAPPDAPGDLVAAWTAFQGPMEGLWLRRREAILEFFTELGREVRRVDSLCGFIHTDVQTVVDERLDEFNTAEARWPTVTSGFLLSELGIGTEILRPMELIGAARTPADVRCPEPEGLRRLVTEAGPHAPAADWAGRYTNGDRFFDLEDRDGLLKVPGENPLDVGHYGGDAYFGSLQGRPILYLRLHRNAAGRRYVILEDRAYIRDEDRPEL